jgi:DNA-binding response OmpR family regulator
MPELHGIEVLRRIRSRDPQTPVIILTGYATVEAESVARMLGVTQFLQKGFSLHELGAALREALGESATHSTATTRLAS